MRGFIVVLAVFVATYFIVALPLLQWLSERRKGRRFVIRLREWDPMDPEQRWDFGLSLLAVLVSLVVAFVVLDILAKSGFFLAPAPQ